MGAGQTKQKQLDQYGQLLSQQEKIAISASFQAIAGSPEVNFFQEDQLQVLHDYCTISAFILYSERYLVGLTVRMHVHQLGLDEDQNLCASCV